MVVSPVNKNSDSCIALEMEQNKKRLSLQSNEEMQIRGDMEVLGKLDYGKFGLDQFVEFIHKEFPKDSRDIIGVLNGNSIQKGT